MKRSIIAILVISLIGSSASGFAQNNQDKSKTQNNRRIETDDFADMRIENEDKLVVPRDKIEEVWKYLVGRLVDDKTFIQNLDPNLDSYWNDEHFVDEYFDTPDGKLAALKSSVRHRKRVNYTDIDSRKQGRELMQVKLNNIDDNIMNRGELKFDIEYKSGLNSEEDIHPVLGIISRQDREDFKSTLSRIGVEAKSLKKILTLKQRRRSIYIPRNGQPFISVRLDECTSQILWAKWRHVEIEPELNETPYTEADSTEKRFMESVNESIINDILQRFPEIQRDLTPKYNKAFQYFEKKIPLFRFMVRNGLL